MADGAHKKLKLTDKTDSQLDREALRAANEHERRLWKRKPLAKPLDPSTDKLTFQQIDVDYTVVDPAHYPLARRLGSQEAKIPMIRMFGVTEEGHSVAASVFGFMPYMYVPVPLEAKKIDEDVVCNNFKKALNNRMRGEVSKETEKLLTGNYILAVTIEQKESIMRFHGNQKSPFFKITTALPKHIPTARRICENGLTIDGLGDKSFPTFESNILFPLRFMIDVGMVGMSWVEIPAGKYISAPGRVSTSQIEVHLTYDGIISHMPDGEWMKAAPLRILSMDIECAARENSFPVADKDPVIQIANMVTVQGESRPFIHNVFVLGTCTPIVGADVRCFDTEREMLLAYREFIVEADPDVIIGYNIMNFDFPYIFDRAAALKLKEFKMMARLANEEVRVKSTTFSSKAYGTRESHDISMFGRVFLDVLQVVQRDYKLRSYTLNSVSAEFLGEQKEDVHHSIISKLHNGSDDDRRRLAVYCLKDAYLPQRLMDKLMCLINNIEMSRVTGVPFSYLLARGQSIRVLSQLYRRANHEGLLVPTYKKSNEGMEESYKGAVVIPPAKAFYDKPIATLDFASLYPSIMMAHNLCYSTLISKQVADTMNPADYTATPAGNYFVKSHVRKGVLAKILEDLIKARNQAKKDMAVETDKFKKDVYNSRQLALKISANSVYGFTGATVGSLPCLEISSSVTAFGRQMIELTRDLVLQQYTVANSYKWDATVIYGDTDSVMVRFGTDDLQESMKLGREAAAFVTSKFIKPIQLEFEKVYYPYLLISKKRYAGLLWTKPDKYDKLDAKGIETVRRDNCLLVKHVVSTCLDMILVNRDKEGAMQFAKDTIRDLLMNKLDISLLVITKALSKNEYKGKQAHVELNEKIKKRDPTGTSYHIGDRIPYVITKGTKGAAAYERAEDPIFALQNNSPIDAQYYLEMLSRPLLRIFKPILSDPRSELLSGEHTLNVSIPTPKSGGIMKFAKVSASCKGCRASLSNPNEVLCEDCRQPDKAPIHYANQLSVVRQKEREFGRLWTQCQNCQGSLHQEVLCTARDCPIFYMRTKVHMDLQQARQQLEKFNLNSMTW